MRINAVNIAQPRKLAKSNLNKVNTPNADSDVAFKGINGATAGLITGGLGSLAGICAIGLAATNPIGWGAAAAMYFGSIGITGASSYAGHKIEDAFKGK